MSRLLYTVLQWTLGYMLSFSIMVFSGYMPNSGTVGSYGSFIPSFLRNCHTVINLHSHQHTTFPFSPHSLQHLLLADFLTMTILMGVWWSHWGFDLHFSNNEQCWAFFDVFISHLDVLFEEISDCLGLVPILWLGCFSDVELHELFVYFVSCFIWIIFSYSEGSLFILFMVSFVVQNLSSLFRSHLFIFVFISITAGGGS